jgi:hypothetical protein
MDSLLQNEAIDKLPVAELQAELRFFLQPVLGHLPEKRLRTVGQGAVQGILGSQSPVVIPMAPGTPPTPKEQEKRLTSGYPAITRSWSTCQSW